MKSNDVYQLALVLDPRIKTAQLKKNTPGFAEIIKRLKTFLKKTYPRELTLPSHPLKKKKSYEFEMLKEYAITRKIDCDVVNRYFNIVIIISMLNEDKDQV